MKAIILIVILAALFCPKDGKGHGKGKKVQRKQQSRPWYDISYDDMECFTNLFSFFKEKCGHSHV